MGGKAGSRIGGGFDRTTASIFSRIYSTDKFQPSAVAPTVPCLDCPGKAGAFAGARRRGQLLHNLGPRALFRVVGRSRPAALLYVLCRPCGKKSWSCMKKKDEKNLTKVS